MSKFNNLNRRTFLASTAAGFATLAMPRLALAKVDDGFFNLRASKASAELIPGKGPTDNLWLYNKSSPGPEIRVKQGEMVRVRFTNDLDVPTSVHWHGIRLANAMDGVSGLTQKPVQPGESFDYVFTVPDAGTFWYHAHNKSWEQVARGLYGPLIVEEPEPAVNAAHDLTLMIDDWRLLEDGSFDVASLGFLGDWTHAGRLGGWLTVNGQSQPKFDLVRGEHYRLRLINAANARILMIDPNAIGAKIIGYDGFPFEKPRKSDRQYEPLLPAQRMDLLLSPSAEGVPPLEDLAELGLSALAGRQEMKLALFNVIEPQAGATKSLVPMFPINTIAMPNLKDATAVELRMGGGAMGRFDGMMHNGKPMESGDFERTGQFWSMNGVANLGAKPLFRATAGETIALTTKNDTGWPHGIHLHGHHFQVRRYNGEALETPIWRDTFSIEGNDTVEIAFVADNPGKWLLHCHMLEHAAAGMNTWFEVEA